MSVERRLILRRVAQTAVACGGGALCVGSEVEPFATDRVEGLQQSEVQRSARGTAPRPEVVSRARWDTAGSPGPLPPARYAATVKAVFVHHTDSGNDYRSGDVPEIIRNMCRDQITRRGWDDIGYNFLVDRYGTVYEGRHGGVGRPVEGAHTSGFNRETVGVAAIGTFGPGVTVPAVMLGAIARLAAWKLGQYGIDPRSTVTLTCSNHLSRHREGARAPMDAIAGHCDADYTMCPGSSLYPLLPRVRAAAARLQGRPGH